MIGSSLVHGHRLPSDDCLPRNAWICPEYVRTRSAELVGGHAPSTCGSPLIAVVVGALIALPLALRGPPVPRPARRPSSASATAIYTIPSLALFSLLAAVHGL